MPRYRKNAVDVHTTHENIIKVIVNITSTEYLYNIYIVKRHVQPRVPYNDTIHIFNYKRVV